MSYQPCKGRAEEALRHWSEVIHGIGLLLPMPVEQVSLEDKRGLIIDLKTATVAVIACVNELQVCELEARRELEKFHEKWGWLL